LTLIPSVASSAPVVGVDVTVKQLWEPLDAVASQAGVAVLVVVRVSAGVLVDVSCGVDVGHHGAPGATWQVGVAVSAGAGVSAQGGDDGLPQSMGIGVTVTHGGELGRPVGTQSRSNGVVVAATHGGEVLPVGSH
jgi:hypothetical protein